MKDGIFVSEPVRLRVARVVAALGAMAAREQSNAEALAAADEEPPPESTPEDDAAPTGVRVPLEIRPIMGSVLARNRFMVFDAHRLESRHQVRGKYRTIADALAAYPRAIVTADARAYAIMLQDKPSGQDARQSNIRRESEYADGGYLD